jgi:hypothetical protein
LNSPETALYTKGQVLFNLDKAKGDARAGYCAAGGRADGLHQRVHGRDCECDGYEWDGVYGAPGAVAVEVYEAGGVEF